MRLDPLYDVLDDYELYREEIALQQVAASPRLQEELSEHRLQSHARIRQCEPIGKLGEHPERVTIAAGEIEQYTSYDAVRIPVEMCGQTESAQILTISFFNEAAPGE